MRRIAIPYKKTIMGLILLTLSGCVGSTHYFMLTGPTVTERHYAKRLPVIGVEKISLPEYMLRGEVATQLSPTQIHYSSSDEWVEDMEDSLTQQLIAAIQKSFNHPNVYAYPWGLSKQAGMKIKISISKFIAYGDYVYLDATWKIKDLQKGKEYNRLFSVKVPSGKDTASVVAGMNKAFGKLARGIVSDLNHRF